MIVVNIFYVALRKIRLYRKRIILKDRYGEEVFYEAEGLLAKAFCHENDHLSGILYIDKAKNVHEVDR